MMTTSYEDKNKTEKQFNSPEEEEKYYKEQNDAMMNDTLDSSRRILKKLDETEKVAIQNMNYLAESDERLHRIHAKAQNVNDRTDRANQHISEFKKYNRHFMVPVLDFSTEEGKQRKDQKLKDKIKRREEDTKTYSEQNTERIRNDIFSAYGKKEGSSPSSSSAQGKVFTWNKDHEAAQEIENNLDKASDGVSRLKLMALSMNQTLDDQNQFIANKLTPSIETAHGKVSAATQRIQKFK